MQDHLKEIIATIEALPPIPQVAMRVLEIAQDRDASATDIVDIIQFDPAVTANCLRLCNSCYFGLRTKISSLHHAVTLIGTDTLAKIVIAGCFRLDAFSKELTGYGLQPGELWHHSVSCAVISQQIARKFDHCNAHALFTAALLHDVGKLVVDTFIAADYAAMFALMQDEAYGTIAVEKAYFGIDHAEVGALIASTWRLPEALIGAIRNHHNLDVFNGDPDIEKLTALSNLLTHGFCSDRSGSGHRHISCEIDRDILNAFNFARDDVAKIGRAACVELERAKGLIAPARANA